MQFQLKPLRADGIRHALDKAHHYRLLNEPWESESICLDVLRTEPENQEALVTLLLSLADQIHVHGNETRGRDVIRRISAPYDKLYYGGLLWERKGKCQLELVSNKHIPYDALRRAMEKYSEAIEMRPDDSELAVLRWNTCARVIMNRGLEPDPDYHRTGALTGE